MDGDTSDILGGPTLYNVHGSQSGWWSSLSFGLKAVSGSAVLLLLYVVGVRVWETLLLWREKSYKLAMRRRHGIPDNDHRPFNVAYAAVMRARQEDEATTRRVRLEQAPPLQDQPAVLLDQQVRQRQGLQRHASTPWPNALPGRYDLSADNMLPARASSINSSHLPLHHLEDRHNPSPVVHIDEKEQDVDIPQAGPSRRASRKHVDIDDPRKRGFDGDESDEPDHAKKTRVEGEELIDGDEYTEWQENQRLPQRGSKRVFGDEDDNEGGYYSKRTRDKRARKFSLEKTPQHGPIDMDIDEEEDAVPELRSAVRGKKRDRAEAGSTFGGDDEDSPHEAEEDDAKARRYRKRRTYAKRKSDAGNPSRGKKRDRLEEGDSELESDDGLILKVSRKKRGKKSAHSSEHDEDDRGGSDISMQDSQRSSSKTIRRNIGDEWESNGVKYKIGPNGQRLRQALVKKARQKFNMPKDSQHPDRQANLEVCIETWLTEEEFREAKDQLLLAWQDSNKPSAEPETPSVDLQDPPSPRSSTGKDLLWKSTSTAPTPASSTPRNSPPGTPQPKQIQGRDPYRQSIATNLGIRINPFQKQTAPSSKRIASAPRISLGLNGVNAIPVGPASPGLADSTNGSPRRGPKMFSKWEKQDLEAKAMMKMREANRKKEEEKAQKLKEEREKAEKAKKEQEAATAAKIIPTITLTKPDEAKPASAETKPPTLSFGPPPVNSSNTAAKPPAPIGGTLFGPTRLGDAALLGGDKMSKPPTFPAPPQPSATGPASTPHNGPPPGQSATTNGNLFNTSKPEPQHFKAPSSFSFPGSSTAAAPPSAGARPSFSFGPTTKQSIKPEEKKDAPAVQNTSTGSSLLSRLAPQGDLSQPQSSPFSFAKPVGEPAKPTSVSGNTSTSQSAISQAAPAAAAASSSGPKFSFGFGKPTSSAASTAPAGSSSSLSGALGNSDVKRPSIASPFGFKAPAESSNSTSSNPTSSGTTAPKFSFAAPSSNSVFGSTTQVGNKTSTPTAPSNATPSNATSSKAPPTFSFAAPSSTSAFGTAAPKTSTTAPPTDAAPSPSPSNATPAPSAFAGFASGATTSKPGSSSPFGTSNVFGGSGASNVFGSTTRPEEAPKASAFGFGTPPALTTPAASPASAPKPAFSFGNTTTSSTSSPFGAPAGGAGAFGSQFGDASKGSTTPQASQPAAGHNSFGFKPSGGPSAFGFGATNTNGGIFGKTPASTGQQQQ